MKPNNNQLQVIKFLKKQLSYWENTNDISSPTHSGDINEELDSLDFFNPSTQEELGDKTESLLRFIQDVKETVIPTEIESDELRITPIRDIGGSCEGKLNESYDNIVAVVGEPNVTDMDDADKVKASWGFQDQYGRKGFIWCYKYYGDPKNCTSWSIDGNMKLMSILFKNIEK